jgi:ribonuclease HI
MHQALNDLNFQVLNMMPQFDQTANRFTSFQHNGRAIVDYFAINSNDQEIVNNLTVHAHHNDLSDHCLLTLEIHLPVAIPPPNHRIAFPRQKRTSLPTLTNLDHKLIDILKRAEDPSIQRQKLFGQTFFSSEPHPVYIAASGHHGSLVCSIYHTEGHRHNRIVPVPGPDRTLNRALLFAILLVLKHSESHMTIKIFCTSITVINNIVWLSPRYKSRGWRCADADILKDVILLIHA